MSDLVFGGLLYSYSNSIFIMTVTKNTFHYYRTFSLSLDLKLAIVVGILKFVENPPDLSAVCLVELVD